MVKKTLAIVLVFPLFGFLFSCGSGGTGSSSAVYEIAFASSRGDNWQIYGMNADGTNQRQITNTNGTNNYPSRSSDGSLIAFVSDRDGNSEVYVMNADGSNQRNVTNDPADDYFPSWSSDGSQIAFVSDRDGDYEVYVMDADGTNPMNITNDPAQDTQPSWSPDGSRIAFSSSRDDDPISNVIQWQVYVMNADGTGQVNITNDNTKSDSFPSWSPGGSLIAFVDTFKVNRSYRTDIYVMNTDGSNQRNLTNADATKEYSPSWSPDGSQIVFTSGTPSDINAVNADGTDPRSVTMNTGANTFPSWSP